MKKKIFLLAVLCTYSHSSQIVQISIPKAGTYLLAKCIQLLTDRQPVDTVASNTQKSEILFYPTQENFRLLSNLPPEQFWITHLVYSDSYAGLLRDQKFIKFFMLRDPRDEAVSLAFFMLKGVPELAQMPFDTLLMDIIEEGKMFGNFVPIIGGIAGLYRSYLSWLQEPSFCAIRFEDLIGPQGGGTVELQNRAIATVMTHLGLPHSELLVAMVIRNIFGNSNTFREGQIGSWKKYFNAEHIRAFKKNAGNILIELHYERDLLW